MSQLFEVLEFIGSLRFGGLEIISICVVEAPSKLEPLDSVACAFPTA